MNTFKSTVYRLLFLMLLVSNSVSGQQAAIDTTKIIERQVMMPDGVKLHTDLFLPDNGEKFPAILYVPPYGTHDRAGTGIMFSEHGYAAVLQNPRGKFGSEGEYRPFIDEKDDLMQTLEWILEQPWSNGKIGIYGSSSSSYSGQILASTGHTAIKALVNLSGLTDARELFFPGGAFRLNTLYPWLTYFYVGERIPFDRWLDIFRALPLASGFGWEPGTLERMSAGSVHTRGIEIPVLHITGWNDVVYRQTLKLYKDIVNYNGGSVEQRLVIGPWAHNYDGQQTKVGDVDFGPESILTEEEQEKLVIAWFDRFLKGDENEITDGPDVEYFVMGANRWMKSDKWPPDNVEKSKFYLGLSANKLPAEQNGTLLLHPPAEKGQLSFTYDPENPVPTYGGVNSHLFPNELGPLDQSDFIERNDVLFFKTEHFDKNRIIAGPIKVVIYASSDAVDTDFTAKLVEIRPDGYHRIIEDGIVRARYRHSFDEPEYMQPGQVYRFEIDLGSTAIEIKEGHSFGVHISSSNFPKYDRNPNTGKDPLKAEELKIARQTVYFSEEYPSHLEISFIKGR